MTLEQPVMGMAARIPHTLVRPGSLVTLAAVARQLPASTTEHMVFEVALQRGGSPLDVSFYCRPAGAGVRALADVSGERLPDAVRQHDVWARLRAFGADWLRAESTPLAAVTHLWLEFDHDAWQDGVPIPCVYLGFYEVDGSAEAAWREVLDRLDGAQSAESVDLLARCLSAQAFSRLQIDLGVMFSRVSDGIRVVFHDVGRGVTESLADLGLSHTDGLDDLITGLRRFGGTVGISLDVGASLGPVVGVEYQFAGGVGATRRRWAALLDHLVVLGCCPAESRDALLEWPGGSVETLDDRFAPAVVGRKISHVKILWQSSLPLRAKAYLLGRIF